MKKITISSKKEKEVIDITEEINEILSSENPQGEGVCHIFALHTTVALSVSDLDPGTDLDLLDAFYDTVPAHQGKARDGSEFHYRHPHNPFHTPAHVLSAMIGPEVSIPYLDGKLILGTWQRVVFFEFDGPQERSVVISLF